MISGVGPYLLTVHAGVDRACYGPCMVDAGAETNPFALAGAGEPCSGWHDVNGCRLYAEVRGHGPAVLIIGAASDDAEMFRPIAERLTGSTVVTYDPRGTLRSSRDGWPCGSAQHADDAGELLRTLGLASPEPGAERRVNVFGASAGGIVALQLGLRHPELVRRVVVYEPGYFQHAESGRALLARATDSADRHLASHPGDWAGAMAAVTAGLIDAPESLEWYTARGKALAENFVRGDLPLTAESVDSDALAGSAADIRFACGGASAPVFRHIVDELAQMRGQPDPADFGWPGPRRPDVIEGAGHVVYFTPAPVAEYLRQQFA